MIKCSKCSLEAPDYELDGRAFMWCLTATCQGMMSVVAYTQLFLFDVNYG